MNSPARNDVPLTPLQQVTWLIAPLTLLAVSLYFTIA
jgi:hypothetical protein